MRGLFRVLTNSFGRIYVYCVHLGLHSDVCSQLVVYQSGVSTSSSISRCSRCDFNLDTKLSYKASGANSTVKRMANQLARSIIWSSSPYTLLWRKLCVFLHPLYHMLLLTDCGGTQGSNCGRPLSGFYHCMVCNYNYML